MGVTTRRQCHRSPSKRLDMTVCSTLSLSLLPQFPLLFSAYLVIIYQFYLDQCSICIIVAMGGKNLTLHPSENIYPNSICLGIEF